MKTELSLQMTELDDFNLEQRMRVLNRLANGEKREPISDSSATNMHMHSFFSYNTHGYSPCHLAWDASRAGLFAAGLCDFDVLDGLDEFQAAGMLLKLRVTVNLETRAFFKEYATVDINSPGEPGVTYIMGAGFVRIPDLHTPPGVVLQQYRDQAQKRNQALVKRINKSLPDIALDYEREVLPLSPSGTPTERHIVRAYRLRAELVFPDAVQYKKFWAETAQKPVADIEKNTATTVAMEEFIRALLVKSGGVGYEKPGPQTFPGVDEFIRWVRECDALPMITWLDGESDAESDPKAMLECLCAKGACALNIIPERNHNIPDPEKRARKLKKLDEIIKTAEAMHLPIQIGTEMNKDGQPFYDDISSNPLKPYAGTFLAGAAIITGHSILTAFANYPYNGTAAAAEFGSKPAERNNLFQSVGQLPAIDTERTRRLMDIGPARACSIIRDSAKEGKWLV